MPFGDKIKRGAKSKLPLQLHQRSAFGQASLALNIMRQHKSEFLAVGPARPVFRWTLRAWHDWPDVRDALAGTLRDTAPHLHSDGPRDERL